MVIVSHGYLLTSGDIFAEPLLSATGYPLGAHAVHIFFALSGFLIAASWHANPDLYHFLAGRFLRLFPALIVVTISLLLICGLVISQPANPLYVFSPEAILFFLRTVFLLDGGGSLQSVISSNEVSGAILATVWTLRYELFCYLTIPILGMIMASQKRMGTLIVGTILLVSFIKLTVFGVEYHDANMAESFARFFFAFYVGVLAWMMRDRIPNSGVLAALLLLAAYFSLGSIITKPLQIIAVAYCAFWLGSFRFGRVVDWLDREDLSYGIYLIGYPIQQAVLLMLPQQPQHALINIVISLAITIPLAFVSWRVIERPALNRRNLATQQLHTLASVTRPSKRPAKIPHTQIKS